MTFLNSFPKSEVRGQALDARGCVRVAQPVTGSVTVSQERTGPRTGLAQLPAQ